MGESGRKAINCKKRFWLFAYCLDKLGVTKTLRKQMRKYMRELWKCPPGTDDCSTLLNSQKIPQDFSYLHQRDHHWPACALSLREPAIKFWGSRKGPSKQRTGICFILWLASTELAGWVLPLTSLQTLPKCTNLLMLAHYMTGIKSHQYICGEMKTTRQISGVLKLLLAKLLEGHIPVEWDPFFPAGKESFM